MILPFPSTMIVYRHFSWYNMFFKLKRICVLLRQIDNLAWHEGSLRQCLPFDPFSSTGSTSFVRLTFLEYTNTFPPEPTSVFEDLRDRGRLTSSAFSSASSSSSSVSAFLLIPGKSTESAGAWYISSTAMGTTPLALSTSECSRQHQMIYRGPGDRDVDNEVETYPKVCT